MTDQDGFHRRLSSGMVLLAMVIGLGLLTMLFQKVLDRQRNPNTGPRTTLMADKRVEVELLANRAGHFVATGYINDVEVEFLLDTGATTIAVPASLARRMSLEKGPAIVVGTANGQSKGYLTRLRNVRLGGIELRDLEATILPELPDGDVLLGMNFLSQIEFTQRGDTLTLKQ